MVQHGHETVPGIERNAVGAGFAGEGLVAFPDDLGGKRDQRALHRVALDTPAVLVRMQRRIVAKRRGPGDLRKQCVAGCVDILSIEND